MHWEAQIDESGGEIEFSDILRDFIGQMDRFCEGLPLTAHLRPFRNMVTPQTVYPSIVLTDLFADTPGQGAGSAYMDELARLCDAYGFDIYTDAKGPQSRDFYLARGFERTTGSRGHQLVRWAPVSQELQDEMDYLNTRTVESDFHP